MPGALDQQMRALAVDLINEYGKTIKLTREITTFDPSTGQTVTTETDYSVVSTPPADFSRSRVDGTLIQQGDMYIEIAAQGLAIAPEDTDKVTIDGQVWSIVGISPVYSGELVTMYGLQLRK